MKKIYTIVILIIASTTFAFAQNRDTRTADKHFDRFEYVKAAEEYQKLIRRGKADDYVYTRLADSYFMVNDTERAEPFYRRVSTRPGVSSETIFNYAQTLKANGKFDESNTMMDKFAQMSPNDSRAVEYKRNPNYITQILEGKPRYSATPVRGLNSSFSDFGATRVGDKIYFSSARNTARKTYGRNQEPFLDIYEATLANGMATNVQPVSGDVNTKFHEGVVAISPDGKRMYFDRNDFFNGKYRKDDEGINQLNIYYAELVDGRWRDIQQVPFNNSQYSVGHPALSPDGKTLYFVSDMPGGFGDADIYKVAINADGSFGEPQNLGPTVNTEGKEVFPFIASDGTLYFSSDGHLGLGGLDVFSYRNGTVTNLGKPINSTSDDFAYSFDSVLEEGFVSSNRGGVDGGGSDNIYLIKQICVSTIHSIVMHADTNRPIGGATVSLYDRNQNRIASKVAGADGKAMFEVECDQEVTVQASATGFEANAVKVNTSESEVNAEIKLRPIDQIIQEDRVVLDPILFDFDKHNIKPQAALILDNLVQLMNANPSMVIKVESHTDSRGSAAYNKELSNRRAQSTVQYVISKGIDASRISGEGKGEEHPAVNCGANCTEAQHQQNRRSEFIIIER